MGVSSRPVGAARCASGLELGQPQPLPFLLLPPHLRVLECVSTSVCTRELQRVAHPSPLGGCRGWARPGGWVLKTCAFFQTCSVIRSPCGNCEGFDVRIMDDMIKVCRAAASHSVPSTLHRATGLKGMSGFHGGTRVGQCGQYAESSSTGAAGQPYLSRLVHREQRPESHCISKSGWC